MTYRLSTSLLAVCLVLQLVARTAGEATGQRRIEGGEVVLRADWHQNVRDLEQEINAFTLRLSQQPLESIDISLAYCSDPQYILDNVFKDSMKAKKVSINLDSCKIGNEGLLRILGKIGTEVEELSLGLNQAGINEKIAKELGEKLQSLSLRKLSLNLLFLQFGDKGVNELFLHPLSGSVEELRLDLTFNKLTPQALSNFSNFLSLANPQTLKSVALQLGSNKIEEKGCSFLAASLSRFDQLQALEIDLYFNSIKSKGARHISQIIKAQKQLQRLTLNLDLNYIQTEGGITIAQALHHQKQLKRLELGVANKNFGYNGFQPIVASLHQLPLLEQLTFRAGINRVGLKGAERLAQALEKISLTHLQLGLSESFLTDEGLQVIGRAISKQARLKTIKANLGFNEARGYGPISILKILQGRQYDEVKLSLTSNPLQDKQVKLMIPSLQSLLRKTPSFDFQLLQTKISEKMAAQLRGLFQGEKKVIHVNSNEESSRIREELEQQNHPGGRSEIIDL